MICTFRHPFWVLASCLLSNLGMDPDRVQPTQVCVPALSWNISRSRIFPNKLFVQTDREKYRELWFEFHIDLRSFFCFWPKFFCNFSNLKVYLYFGTYQVDLYFIFSYKFGMYLTKEKWISISFWTSGPRFFNWAIWTQNESKIDFHELVFKGLKEIL